jgi:hypothetical protein
MTVAERQRRYIARREEAAAKLAKPPPIPAPAENTIRLIHLKMDPVQVARWVRQKLGANATRAVRDAFDQVLGDPAENK